MILSNETTKLCRCKADGSYDIVRIREKVSRRQTVVTFLTGSLAGCTGLILSANYELTELPEFLDGLKWSFSSAPVLSHLLNDILVDTEHEKM